ncbi:DM13 domain-containing protein [Halotia branconii]|uniref:DM13 domain-containing protein n=1 Tax=Halotia branconii CENA392 TaxID=1539056 RepID=A0AAJ6NN59_9CYAN|nr:DM13 domain-containing protein [Halotia branconii]WGV23313.1 DM13 domain-containing protein [Halotia branconii CENA392]
MKFKHLAILAIATVFTINLTKQASSNPPATQTPVASLFAASMSMAESGKFQSGEHPTQGTVKVIAEQGKRYLEFDQSFQTDSGPDLFVILYRSDAPPITGIKEKDYVSIARLKSIKGTQRYALPDNLKLAEFKSVAIWCRQFNATFGYASLKG